MEKTSNPHHDLAICIDHLIPGICTTKMRIILTQVDIYALSEDQIESLKDYDYHTLPGIDPMISVTFANGAKAVELLRGILENRWTEMATLALIDRYETERANGNCQWYPDLWN